MWEEERQGQLCCPASFTAGHEVLHDVAKPLRAGSALSVP